MILNYACIRECPATLESSTEKTNIEKSNVEYSHEHKITSKWLVEQWAVTIQSLSELVQVRQLVRNVSMTVQKKVNAEDTLNGKTPLKIERIYIYIYIIDACAINNFILILIYFISFNETFWSSDICST